MMEDKRVAEYFVLCGLPEGPHEPLDGFSDDAILKPTYKQDPIVDLVVINKGQGETPPQRFRCIETTPTGFPADLNHGSIRYPEMYLCYRRGRDKPPITDIGILYDGKEKISPGCDGIYQTPYGRSANVNNNSNNHIYITYRRAMENASCDTLAVMDICVILANKGETPPHAFMAVDKTLNKSMMGSTVYLCYKKSMAKTNFLAYKPDILCRYPAEDHADFPLAHNVSMFCLPLGATIEAWPAQAQHPMPKFSTFVLTQETGGKVYGAAVTFNEDYDEDQLSHVEKEQLELIMSPARRAKQGPKTVHASKCICLLSRWPFFNTFKTFLHYLYRISISGPHPVPLERYIAHFMNEVPFPTPQRPRIQVELNFNTISLFLPEESPLPQSGASYTTLLKHLGPENCMNVLLFTLMEHKILIHSLCPAVLTSAAEAIASMIFPFHWNCPYIPLCPLALSEYLCAPTPFIVGVDSRYFDLFDPPPDVTCVDLDTNTVSIPDDKKNHSSSFKIMPKKLVKQLRTTLEKLHELCCLDSYEGGVPLDNGFETFPVDQDVLRRKKRLEMESAIQEAFLRFMASLLKGYNKHLLPITQQPNQMTTDFTARFDVQGFIKSREKAHQKFYQQLKDTQNFCSFIQERSFVSDKDASLAFFDECMEKVEEGKEDVKLLELEDSSKSERTVVITPPEPEPNGKIINYTKFPVLDPSLFPQKVKPTQLSVAKHPAQCPNSPMTKRTKQEVRIAQKAAKKFAASPDMWAKCLLWHCYSLWFIHLPSYVKSHRSKAKALRNAYDVLCKMQGAKLQAPDEVCYRVLMQLCGQYHQPIMAVRVFSEMRRHGVNPNAITYGFYNKAVLESKWPSSDTAYLRWNKVRNAIMVIAQFRRNLHIRRRQSMCSMSESDCDRISRGSIDSYLDEANVDKTDGAKAAEIVSDLINMDGQNSSEEKSSTGGMSDRGYSSMTLDDAKRISIVIGSQDSLDSVDKTKQKVKDTDQKLPNGRVPLGTKVHQNHVKEKSKDNLNANEVTNSMSVEPQAPPTNEPTPRKLSGIVRRSHDGGSGSGSCRDELQNALLMTSDTTLDDSVFGDSLGVSQIAGTQKSSSPDTVHSVFKESSNDSGIAQSGSVDILGGSVTSERPSSVTQSSSESVSESNVEMETKDIARTSDIGVIASSTVMPVRDPFSPIQENLPSPLLSSPPQTDMNDTTPINTPHSSMHEVTPDSSQGADHSSASNNTLLECGQSLSVCADPEKPARPDMDDSLLLEDSLVSFQTSSPVSDENSPNKSLTSPIHSIRTPVTENDPLGLFIPPTLSAVASAPVLAGRLHEHLNHGTSIGSLDSPPSKSHGPDRDMLIDLQPFSNTSTPVRNRWAGVDCTKTDVSSSSPSSPGSPLEPWSPLSVQAQGQPSLAGAGQIGPSNQTPTAAKKKASTLPPMGTSAEHVDPLRHSKTPSRSESFGSAFRSVTSRVANKLTEFKQSMGTPSKGMGSSGSLHRHDVDRLITEEEEESQMRKAGSLDHLGQGDRPGLPPHLAKQAGISSLEDIRATPNRGKLAMPGLFNKASHLLALGSFIPPRSSMQGWATKFGSMKETLKTTLKDSFSLGEEFTDSEDEDYYYKSTDQHSFSSGTTKDDDASLHDYNSMDKAIHSILEPRDETDGGSGDRASLDRLSLRHGIGSMQSIPQTLFNIAVEVEICSLSRCKTCKSLLYDEEIMAGWMPNDSNLNTTCPFCAYQFVPSLQVFVKDYRHCSKPTALSPSQSMDSVLSIHSTSNSRTGAMNHAHHNGAHRSMTSLSSTDNVLSGSGDSKSFDSHSVQSGDLLTETIDAGSSNVSAGEGFMNDSSPNVHTKSRHPQEPAVTISTSTPSDNNTLSSVQAKTTNEQSLSGGNLIQLSPPSTPLKLPPEPIAILDMREEISDSNVENSGNVDQRSQKTEQKAHREIQHGRNVNQDQYDEQDARTAEAGVLEAEGQDKHIDKVQGHTVDGHIHVDVTDSGGSETASNDGHTAHRQCVKNEPITVPYLSPLVLRKELENVLEHIGEHSLNSAQFVDGHPIIYWNLLWYFKRLDVTSHIPGFILTAASTNPHPAPKVWASADSRHVSVRAVWDNIHMHEEESSFPLYLLWKKAIQQPSVLNVPESPIFTKSVLSHILKHIRDDDLATPLLLIMQEREKMRASGNTRFRSMYRDLMFLTLVAFSRDSVIDLELFDREYRIAYQSLPQKEKNRTHVYDTPPTPKTSHCRKSFNLLEL